MGHNTFGIKWQFTTWGESHGKGIGVVIDGCPPNLSISEEEINAALRKRAPGSSLYTSPRKEPDIAEIWSGVYEGKTTGHPISIIIKNHDARPQAYRGVENILRPGHANATYLQKYGIFDPRGGGRASARETASRVAAGAVAKKVLEKAGIQVFAFLKQVGNVMANVEMVNSDLIERSPIFCPDPIASKKMEALILKCQEEGDSIGALVEVHAFVPAGLGDPMYHKLDAMIASGLMSIHATKGVEIGKGFDVVTMKGSENNDAFIGGSIEKGFVTETNHAGGVLGGISTGMPIVARVAFKPTSSIKKKQKSIDLQGNPVDFELPEGSRHDPCVGVRAVPVVEAMMQNILADFYLLSKQL